jgi:serine protease
MKKTARVNTLADFILWAIVLAFLGCGFDGDDRSNSPQQLSFEVSGTVTAAARFVADSDVNDPAANRLPNDSFAQAQELPNPVVLGGYVNLPQTGIQGRSYINGDPSDFFTVDLSAGQAINLVTGQATGAELDLVLYDGNQTPIERILGPAVRKSVTAPANGTYFVEVQVVIGAATYTLTVGPAAPSVDQNALRLSDEFVPGEFIVRFQALPQGSGPALSAAAVGLANKAGASGREMLLTIGDDLAQQQTARLLGIPESHRSIRAADDATQRKLQTLQMISALRKRPDVKSADPNFIRRLSAGTNDPQYALQWHYPLINLPLAWDVTTGSANVIVAVIDSGVLMNHPDLQGRLIAGYDFIRDPVAAGDGDGIDSNPEDPGTQTQGGTSFHGTHVTGTIAALAGNALGVAGVTQATQVMPLRAIGIGAQGNDFDILQAVRYAAGLDNDSGTLPAQRADVINLSLGGPGFSQTSQDVFNEARGQGLIVVAAAGNESSTIPFYPAAHDGVASVSAVDINANLAWYSNIGPTIDVAAPGGDTTTDLNGDDLPDGVLSTCGEGLPGSIRYTYCPLQGTSMASPHVAGVVALMKAVYPTLTPDEFDQLLINGFLTGSAGRDDHFGYGRIDAFLAVAAALELAGGAPLPPTIIARPAILNLAVSGTGSRSVDLEIRNGASAPMTIGSVVSDPAATWLSVAEKTVDANKLGIYSVTANPGSLAPGVYAANIMVTATDPAVKSAAVPVRLEVFSPIGGGNVGAIYVLLVDPATLATVAQVSVPFDGDTAQYRYSFTDVPAGTYMLFAGTDADNDGVIGDSGEARGGYRTVDQPISVTIPGANTELDFAIAIEEASPPQPSAQGASLMPILERAALPMRSMK